MADEADLDLSQRSAGAPAGGLRGETSPALPIGVLIVDADVPTRIGVRMILSSVDDIAVVGEAATRDDAVTLVARHRPDVALLDIWLAGTDGIAAIPQITASSGGRTKVVVFTTLDGDGYEHRALGAGATVFLLKRASPYELISALRVAGRGEATAPNNGRGPLGGSGLASRLTDREREVLHQIAQGLSNPEIASRLYVSIDTVKSHLKHIYAKLEVSDRMRLVFAARESGFGVGPPTA
jgi:DNA-binding NarL/FixJ family response regulator